MGADAIAAALGTLGGNDGTNFTNHTFTISIPIQGRTADVHWSGPFTLTSVFVKITVKIIHRIRQCIPDVHGELRICRRIFVRVKRGVGGFDVFPAAHAAAVHGHARQKFKFKIQDLRGGVGGGLY